MTALALDSPLSLAAATFGRSPKMSMNEAQFEAFYRSTAGRVWSYIHRMTGDAAAADDLLQKTFFRFLRSNPALESEEHLRRYIFKTATNLVFDYFRDSKRQRTINETTFPDVRPDRHELRVDMMRVFELLKPQERVLLWLAPVEGASHAEIAAAIGAKEKSIKVMLFRARKRLGDMLSKRGLAPV
jgi:RNA polymerase sigma factor (sigma-70 family)